MLIVVLSLIELDGRILLIQEAKASCAGKWFLPGGRLEQGESLADCARREVREEAGLDVEPLGLLYVDQLLSDGTPRPGRLRFVLRARPTGGAFKSVADSHSLGASWFKRDEIGRLALRSSFVNTIVELAEQSPTVLPMSSVHTLTPSESGREQP